jgi:hypothetical protein
VEYNGAIERIPMLNHALAEIFASYDAILTPAAMSVAPMGLDHRQPIFARSDPSGRPPSAPILRGTGGAHRRSAGAGRRDDARLALARWLKSGQSG